jgi:hypothetical protein
MLTKTSGKRGRPPGWKTGRRLARLYVTAEEEQAIRQFLETLREQGKSRQHQK